MPDHKLIATGASISCEDRGRGPCEVDPFVVRLRGPRRLDSEFGEQGVVKPKLGAEVPTIYGSSARRGFPTRLALLPDERMIVAGHALRRAEDGGFTDVYMLARLRDVVAPRPARPLPSRLRVRRGVAPLRLGCVEAGADCRARLRLGVGGRVAARRSLSLEPGRTVRVKLVLGPGVRRRLASGKRLRARISLELRDPNGNSLTTTRRLALVRLRR
jgi:hypothetical protein